MTSANLFLRSVGFFRSAGRDERDFLTSIALISQGGLLPGGLCSKIKLPPLVGILAVGIALGPYALNLISPDLLNLSPSLREIALIIILTRAGLKLNLADLKKNGIAAVLLCFVPALCEIGGYILAGMLFLKLSFAEAALLGCVMAAVSPAVVVPRMLKLKELSYGTDKGIPDMIVAGASSDDVFVIVLFTSFLTVASGGAFSANIAWQVPVSIITGVLIGISVGLLFVPVGAEVNFTVASPDIGKIIGIILFALIFRAAGVTLCLIGSGLNVKERLFCVIAYLPKATVQAAIGAVPLAAGLACGQTILTFAVLAILITAPLGALLTDLSYKKLLNRENAAEVEA